jgi:hypothetical protein
MLQLPNSQCGEQKSLGPSEAADGRHFALTVRLRAAGGFAFSAAFAFRF